MSNTFLQQAYPRQMEYVNRIFDSNQFHHGFLVISDQSQGLRQFVDAWIQRLLCSNRCGACDNCSQLALHTHVDILTLRRLEEKQRISLEQAHSVHHHLSRRPLLGACRIVRIQEADRLTIEAANALLKVVEEPPSFAMIFFETTQPDSIPATIQSRLQPVRLPSIPREQLSAIEDDGKSLPEYVQRSFWLSFLQEDIAARDARIQSAFLKGKESKKALHHLPEILQTLESIFHDVLLNGYNMVQPRAQIDGIQQFAGQFATQQTVDALRRIATLKEMCQNNVNKKMIFDYLILSL